MKTYATATEFVITCIENGDATRDEFDVEAIVAELHELYGSYDFEAHDAGATGEADDARAFWDVVAKHVRPTA